MAATMKRKQSAEEGSSKASKRQKAESKHKDAKQNRDEPSLDQERTTSILVKEQPAFPRGGAGLLTPLEKKQISARASRDFAAEQSKAQDLFGGKHSLPADSDNDESDAPKETKPEGDVRKKKASKRRKVKETASTEKPVSIEGLSYKRLAVGSLILGCVSSINAQDLTIALPNNLSGFVPLTSISSSFSAKIESALTEGGQENEDSDEETEDISEISLEKHFKVGQFVRVAVTALGADVNGKSQSKKKIVLSLDPKLVNVGLQKSNLATGCTIQAAITSVEDHGLIADIGIGEGNASIKGFIPTKALGSFISISEVQEGSVLLCTVTEAVSGSKIIKLSANLSKSTILKNVSSVDALLPGTQVEILVSETSTDGIAGKIIGLVDATADIVHSGSYLDRESFAEKYKPGQKVRGRLICTFPHSDHKKLGFSLLENIVGLEADTSTESNKDNLGTSAIIPSARVVRVAPGLGVYLSLPSEKLGFAHISRLSDKKVDSVSETTGAYKLGSEHKARVLDFNAVDQLFLLSLQKKTLDQPFLRLEDVPVGETVKATIEKVLIGPAGVSGLILNLAEGVSGLVPQIHMSDITLLHPERKFKEGQTVAAKVLQVDKSKRQIRLSLKKTLLNSDQKIWATFSDIEPDASTVGTLVKVDPYGALVQFYGAVRGFLPVSEMSEAYIKDATEHFKVGQVLTINALSINAEEERLTVSCRDRGASNESSLASVIPGTLVSGTIFEKSQSDILLRLEGSDVIARLALDQVSDGSEKKRLSTLEKFRVGQKLENVLVLDVQRAGRLVILCNRQSLIQATQNGQFLKSWEDLKQDVLVTGYVSNITEAGVFVRFAGGINGLVPKRQVPSEAEDQPDFGLKMLQTITARVLKIDYRGATPRFWLTMRQDARDDSNQTREEQKPVPEAPEIIQPVDDTVTTFTDFAIGKVTKARITSIKDTQINVELAKDIQGRVDISEIFDTWDDIKDRKHPLKSFSPRQILPVRILGAHDTRNHRFLPLSHRAGKNTVFELSAKPSSIKANKVQYLSLSDMPLGSSWIAFVNNIVEDRLMVNISPAVRGRIKAIDVSDDLSLATDLEGNYPVGSAVRVRVLSVDLEKNHLDLTGRSSSSRKPLTFGDLSPGMILPGRVTKVSDRSILVQMSDDLVGAVDLIDMTDDYAKSNPAQYQKNDVVRVFVIKVDIPNKKVILSTRPSKVLSSSIKAVDPEITSVKQLKLNDVVRGFVSSVSDKGLFVTLGHGVTALVRVTNLSDAYLKSWKDGFQRDQLVKGKIITIDEGSGHIQLSLKESVISGIYKPPVTFTGVKVGDIVTGKVVKVETFGVFILVDNSENVRGLCHRSEIAEQRIEDVSKLFNQGDAVKAKILKLDLPNRRINFGLKASYFTKDDEDEDMEDPPNTKTSVGESDDSDIGGAKVEDEQDSREDTDAVSQSEDEDSDVSDEEGKLEELSSMRQPVGLSVGGFDWYGMSSTTDTFKQPTAPAVVTTSEKRRKKDRKSEIQIDRTGDLDTNGPQSTDDFERLLLGEPDSSVLWLQYMAFYLELGDTDAARQIGERALKTIGIGQDTEKLNIWIALLNLENVYGDEETIGAMFERALEYNDPQEIYTRLTSIYIQSGKHEKADSLFQDMLKRFTQDPKIYINYATFLFDTVNDAERGRAQLTRALQVLPSFTHFDLTSKFAQLEFKSSAGLPERGRTIFEGLINSFPKRVDLFNVLLDLEIQQADKDVIRALFERIFQRKLKPKQAKYFFKRWLTFEEAAGDERRIEDVKAKAATWVKSQG